ncbi:MAG: pyridoxal-phosphate dependent enzyme, partial [Acidobacteria bacterium]|nr:pyridoxal-phosphate dependent enzyme [Acidobacteriota bacterium]
MSRAPDVTLQEIRVAAARIRGRVIRTPLRHSPWLSKASGGDVYLKIETVQPTHSYKIRGATNAVLKLAEGTDATSLVTASAGNHGRALAHAAAAAGMRLTVYLPETAPRTKIDAIRELGGELRPCSDYDEAECRAKDHAARGIGVFISPYAHPDVIAGAGTVGLEILEELDDVEAVIASIGGGGLISGIAIATDGRVETAGVEVEASTPFTTSLKAGRITEIAVGPTLADGLSGNLDPESPTFDIVRTRVTRISVVSEDDLTDAIRGVAEHERLIIEGAAAAAVAAVATGKLDIRGQRAAIVLSGANIDLDRWGQI